MASDNVPWAPKGDETLPRRRRLAIIIAVLLVVGAGVLVGPLILRPLPDESKDMPPATFETPRGTFRPTPQEWAGLRLERVTIRTFRTEKMAEGIIAIDDNLTTPVFCHYSGHVMKLIAKPGDHVEPVAPLFEIEASEFVQAQNDLITALANLQSGRSQLALAQINEKRAHELYSANGGALKDWQQAQTNLIAAENTVRADEIALHAVRRRLRILGKTDDEIASLEAQPTQKLNAVTIVTAPIAGTITQRQVGIGQYVASLANGATTPVYTISDLSTVWLIANVREVDTPSMHVGHSVEVRVLAYPGHVFKAKISWVAPSIDPNTHRLPVRADVENPDGALKPGMFADFSIITGEASTDPAVPQEAILYEGDRVRVWVAGEGDTLALREIRTGRSSDGMVEVLAGLSAGEKVVTSGTVFIDRAAKSD